MSIIRMNRAPSNFFQAYKPPFQNKKLSFAARGLLAYLCTKPDGWEVKNYDLVKASPGGKAALQTILKELREAGHLHRYAKRKPDGSFDGWNSDIYENPENNPHFMSTTDIPISGKTGNPNDGKPERRETGERKEVTITSTNNKKDIPQKFDNLTKTQKVALFTNGNLPKKAKPLAAHIIKNVTGRWPNRAVYELIDIVEVKDKVKFEAIVREWIARGYNPQNFSGMIEVFKNGWKNGNGKSQVIITPPKAQKQLFGAVTHNW